MTFLEFLLQLAFIAAWLMAGAYFGLLAVRFLEIASDLCWRALNVAVALLIAFLRWSFFRFRKINPASSSGA